MRKKKNQIIPNNIIIFLLSILFISLFVFVLLHDI